MADASATSLARRSVFDRLGPSVAWGAFGGLAWACALRAYMVELVGSASRIEWVGTYLQILLPAVITGALLGLAEYFRRTGGRPGWRWLAAAPVVLAVAPLLSPGAFIALITTGIGGGAVAVALTGILGGYAVSRRGPLWARIICGLLSILLILGGAASWFGMQTPLTVLIARGVWVGLLYASLMVVLVMASSIPHRPVVVTAGAEASA